MRLERGSVGARARSGPGGASPHVSRMGGTEMPG